MRAVVAAALGLLVMGAVAKWHDGTAPQPDDLRPGPADAAAAQPAAGRDPDAMARHRTPEGTAAVELEIIPHEIDVDGEVVFHLVNRGDLPLRTGLAFEVQRWDGEAWGDVTPVEDGEDARWAWPGVAVELHPGGTTARQTWPVSPWGPPRPGRYRLVKTATSAHPEHDEGDVELRVEATFRVRG